MMIEQAAMMWRRVFSSSSSSHLKTLGWRSSPQILVRNPSRALSSLPIHPQSHILGTKVASASVFQQALRFSTGDSDTHEDFRPTSNLQSSGVTLQDVVRQEVEKNPVMIYMKGIPDAPRCGFSALAVKILQQYPEVPICARNILEDAQLKETVKAVSNWPTFPQIFIKGDFVGGSDIVLEMHQKGQLKELLADINADNGKA